MIWNAVNTELISCSSWVSRPIVFHLHIFNFVLTVMQSNWIETPLILFIIDFWNFPRLYKYHSQECWNFLFGQNTGNKRLKLLGTKWGPEIIEKWSANRRGELLSPPICPGPVFGYDTIVPSVESTAWRNWFDSYHWKHKCFSGSCWGTRIVEKLWCYWL